MTSFITSYKELFNINTVEEFLKTKNVKYNKNENNDFIKIIVNNEDSVSLTSGLKNSKGKDIFFYFKNTKSVLHISNGFSWYGRGESFKTFNSLNFHNFDELNTLKNNLEKNKNINLIEIYKIINLFFNIKMNNSKKYQNFNQYKEENYESLQKLIKKEFENKIFIENNFDYVNRYNKYNKEEKININIKIDETSENIFNVDKKYDIIKNIMKKINLKLEEKISYLNLNNDEIIEFIGDNLLCFNSDKIKIKNFKNIENFNENLTLIECYNKNVKNIEKVFETIENNLINNKKYIISLDNNSLNIVEDNIVSLNTIFDLYNDINVTKKQAETIKEFIEKTLNNLK